MIYAGLCCYFVVLVLAVWVLLFWSLGEKILTDGYVNYVVVLSYCILWGCMSIVHLDNYMNMYGDLLTLWINRTFYGW